MQVCMCACVLMQVCMCDVKLNALHMYMHALSVTHEHTVSRHNKLMGLD